ncbi:EpsG family protein [Marinomonas spartinae]|nr:EpsG family protein [Marinomonas spartinae]
MKRNNYMFLFYTIGLGMIFLSGMRSIGFGADDLNYANLFLNIDNILPSFVGGYNFSHVNMSPFLVYFAKIIHLFFDDSSVFFLCVAFLSIWLKLYSISRLSLFPFISLLLYFSNLYFQMDLNQIRAGLSLGFLFLSFLFLIQNRFIFSLLFSFFAILTHISALVFLPCYFFVQKEFRRNFYFFILIVAYLVSIYGLGHALSITTSSIPFLGEKISYYLEISKYNNALSFFDIVNVKNSFIVIFALIFFSRLKAKSIYFLPIFNVFFYSVVLRYILGDFSVLAARSSIMLNFSEWLLVPIFFTIFKNKLIPLILVLIYCFVEFYILLLAHNWAGDLGVMYLKGDVNDLFFGAIFKR